MCKRSAAPLLEPAAPLPEWSSPPGTPPALPAIAEGIRSYEIESIPSSGVYMHSPLPNTQIFNDDAFAKDRKRDKDFIPGLLSTLSTGWKYS
jgi:hypothetical protein